MLVHDFNFNSLVDGRVAIVDLTAPNANLKGTFSAAQFGNVLASSVRPELYSAETFYSRLSRGERTDVITIWDTASLKPTGEIVLPGGKRGQFVTFKNTFQFTNGERWALVYDFTPGASVTVVDLVARKVLGDVDMPGCSQMYPTGARGFSTLCADGTMTTIRLDEAGKVASTSTSARVNDIDHDPFFMMPAYVGRTAWFVSFRGTVHGFDFAGDEVRDLGSFALGTAAGAKPEWRPGGWQVASADKAGRVYVLMNPNGREGSHKDGGSAVWVVDPAKRAVVQRIALLAPAVSIEATQQASPLLVAARADGVLDVYDAGSGRRVRSLGGSLVFNPMTMTALP